jgi:hypothetical protein
MVLLPWESRRGMERTPVFEEHKNVFRSVMVILLKIAVSAIGCAGQPLLGSLRFTR